MPKLNPKRFSQPEMLSSIRRESLLKWLAPAREYFAARGIVVPYSPSARLDCVALASAFVDPEPEMPVELVESLQVINELADPRGMDAILQAVEKQGVTLILPKAYTPADVAMEAWLQCRDLLEAVHLEHQVTRSRRFVHFASEEKVSISITPEKIQAIESRLDAWYASKHRGRG
ncbi:MAG: hypothetical protein ACK4UN_09230, partial [Limisphaerales bacterium]